MNTKLKEKGEVCSQWQANLQFVFQRLELKLLSYQSNGTKHQNPNISISSKRSNDGCWTGENRVVLGVGNWYSTSSTWQNPGPVFFHSFHFFLSFSSPSSLTKWFPKSFFWVAIKYWKWRILDAPTQVAGRCDQPLWCDVAVMCALVCNEYWPGPLGRRFSQ